MSIRGNLFFTLLVTLAITGIHSGPVGGKGSKLPGSSGGKKTVDENVFDINKRKVPEDIHRNSAIDPQTVNRHADVVSGDDGNIPSNIAGPSESNPSHQYRKDSPIRSTNPLIDALSSTQLKRKEKNTKSDGTSEKKVLKSTLLSQKIDEMKNKLTNHEERLEEPVHSPSAYELIELMTQATTMEAISREIVIPDIISVKVTFGGSFEDIKVPEELKSNPKSYKEWLMTKLPDHGYYRDKVGSNQGGRPKSIEQTKTIIKLLDHETYGLMVPKRVLYIDESGLISSRSLPERAKENFDKFNEWLHEEMSKYSEIFISYNPSLSIKYRGTLKRRN